MSLRNIELLPYSASWPMDFAKEAVTIKAALGNTVIDIHHIGSTSVPGLMAKPIIDILLIVSSLADLDAKAQQMLQIGYDIKGEFGIPGRRYFPKGGLDRTHQVHAFVQESEHIARHLAFRDFLISHSETAQAYQDLKLRVVKSCDNDMQKYCDGKDPFVKKWEAIALAWWQEKG